MQVVDERTGAELTVCSVHRSEYCGACCCDFTHMNKEAKLQARYRKAASSTKPGLMGSLPKRHASVPAGPERPSPLVRPVWHHQAQPILPQDQGQRRREGDALRHQVRRGRGRAGDGALPGRREGVGGRVLSCNSHECCIWAFNTHARMQQNWPCTSGIKRRVLIRVEPTARAPGQPAREKTHEPESSPQESPT